MVEIIMRNWDFREFHVQDNLPSPIGQVSVPIRCTITLRQGHLKTQASVTPNYANPLISSTSFSSSLSSLLLTHNSPIIAELKVKASLSSSPCHDQEISPSCSIHRVQHTPSIVYTYYCLSSLPCHDLVLTPECCFSLRCASLHRLTATSQFSITASKVKSPLYFSTVLS